MMNLFSTNQHTFVNPKFGETHSVNIYYYGIEELTTSNFIGSCNCTSLTYNAALKMLTVDLHMDVVGVKQSSVTANIPEGQFLLLFNAHITQ